MGHDSTVIVDYFKRVFCLNFVAHGVLIF